MIFQALEKKENIQSRFFVDDFNSQTSAQTHQHFGTNSRVTW